MVLLRRILTLAPVLALVLGVGITREARAGGKVDWSDYLEPPGARPVPVKHVDTAPPTEARAPSRATKKAAKAAKAKSVADRNRAKKQRSAKRGKRR